jgi:hypothetical protein
MASSTDCETIMAELDKQYTEISNDLSEFNNLKKIQDIKSKINKYKINIDKLQVNCIIDNNKNYKSKFREHRRTLREFKSELNIKSSQLIKSNLFDNGESTNINIDDSNFIDPNHAVMEKGLDIQDASTTKLKEINRKIHDTIDIGTNTLGKLNKNTEQIANADDKIESVDLTLVRSLKIIKRIGRKLATDKMIWCLLILLVLAIIGILIWKYEYANK